MAFRPAAKLRSRTFVGLLIAQFLAAFNDQAIHASAMFFALHKGTLSEAQAVNLMPVLFYSPWAIFVTMAAFLADRYSKRHSLVFWKFAEVAITAVATFGFWLGAVHHHAAGPWIVLGCVFLMGLHSAFFVPAKYGAMPEILEPQLLSKGNGWLEMLSFMAIILGTVSGGLLSYWFQRRETIIGLIFFGVAIVGAASSLLIETMPPANPGRTFPRWIYLPLWQSLKILFAARPLRLAVIGIAFFTFIVAFMRATVYMLGLAQNPPWNEFKTSVIVGMSAFGIGLGSPIAGWLSGRKIELGLVPLGGLGMIVGVLCGALALAVLHGSSMVAALVVSIVLIGFCTSFYLVPMYTLLQHRAPKTSKGDAVATSNFFNVTGAMLASLVSLGVVSAAKPLGITPAVPGKRDVVTGALVQLTPDNHGRLAYAKVDAQGVIYEFGRLPGEEVVVEFPFDDGPPEGGTIVVKASSWVESHADELPEITVSRYDVRNVTHYRLRSALEPSHVAYDLEPLPRYLFLGAGFITLLTLGVLVFILPDLPSRAAWVVLNIRGPKVGAVGTHHLQAAGPVVLATNVRSRNDYRFLRSAMDRYSVAIGIDGLKPETWLRKAQRAIGKGRVVILAEQALLVLGELTQDCVVLPTYVGPVFKEMRVSFGSPLTSREPTAVAEAIKAAASAEDDYHGH